MTTSVAEIVISPYRASWPQEFHEIAVRLRSGFGAAALRIDHVGSTSVRGLAAKDVIDVQVTVAALEPDVALREAIARAGFAWREDILRDHVPPGDSSPAYQWEKRYARERTGRRVHIHIRGDGRANQRYALLFRDFLRAHPHAAEAYARAKRSLAELCGNDRGAYADAKDPVCDLVFLAGDAWARASGWSPAESDA